MNSIMERQKSFSIREGKANRPDAEVTKDVGVWMQDFTEKILTDYNMPTRLFIRDTRRTYHRNRTDRGYMELVYGMQTVDDDMMKGMLEYKYKARNVRIIIQSFLDLHNTDDFGRLDVKGLECAYYIVCHEVAHRLQTQRYLDGERSWPRSRNGKREVHNVDFAEAYRELVLAYPYNEHVDQELHNRVAALVKGQGPKLINVQIPELDAVVEPDVVVEPVVAKKKGALSQEQALTVRQRYADGDSATTLIAWLENEGVTFTTNAIYKVVHGITYKNAGGPIRGRPDGEGPTVRRLPRTSNLTVEIARTIRERYATGEPASRLAGEYSTTPAAVYKIVSGVTWVRAGGPTRNS